MAYVVKSRINWIPRTIRNKAGTIKEAILLFLGPKVPLFPSFSFCLSIFLFASSNIFITEEIAKLEYHFKR